MNSRVDLPLDALARELAEHFAATGLSCLELTSPTQVLRLSRQADGELHIETLARSPAAVDATLVRAGCPGRVRLNHPLHTEPLVRPGQVVEAGQALLLLQVGQVLLPVPAPRAGRVLRLRIAEGSVVGHGDALLDME